MLCAVILSSAPLVRAQPQEDASPGSPPETVPLSRSHPAVELARNFLGTPYRFASADPLRGFDCSGLVHYVFGRLQVPLPRTPRDQFRKGLPISQSDLRPGDLVFFNTFAALSHVGIYIGEGLFIHAPRTGKVVSIEAMGSTYYRKRFAGARRVSDPQTP